MGSQSALEGSTSWKDRGFTSTLHRFYRGTLYQAIVLGLISFTQPGIWTALNNLGAGGEASPFFVNAANVITFAIMVFFAPISAVLGNRLNIKWVLVFGTIGYVPYSAALYCNSVYGTEWFLLFGAATCGFSAAALWVSEAAIAVGYPELKNRGFYISIWLALNKIGQIIATSIQLALNIHADQKGSISPNTYLVLVALECLGLPLSLTIAEPHKVIRTDGTKPGFGTNKTPIKKGFKDFWRVCKRKEILLLVPIFIAAQWGQTYQGIYLVAYFSVRGRSLAGFIASIVSTLTDFLLGWLLDTKVLRRSLVARISWIFIFVAYTATWIYNFVMQKKLQEENASLDIDSPGFGKAVGVYILYRIGFEAINVWMYWVLGTLDADIATLALSTSLLRAGESLGSTFSYGVGASKSASLMTNLTVSAVVFWASVPTTTWSAWKVTDVKPESEDFDAQTQFPAEQSIESISIDVNGDAKA
ncbi:MFS general substrate transporter [Xylona heveae TC161]|uniref:MFS general substrate transporter n=1 Tax=Xylona heveae (strain CBS 132557 / TC161) TaxID=1328760 RepID=A0A164ZUM0_XYLHT|nr:MFS general substrate transporter [Xylona heveae TC161]KZF19549.1 MFS general substrate transporter [Xylona heveae TC161]